MYKVSLDASGNILELFGERSPANIIPVDAVDVSDEVGEILRRKSSFAGLALVEGVLVEVLDEAVLFSTYDKALTAHLDSVAKSDGWESRISLTTRAGYSNPWQGTAIAFGTWMDECNILALTMLGQVKRGEIHLPTVGEFIAALPVFVFPERS